MHALKRVYFPIIVVSMLVFAAAMYLPFPSHEAAFVTMPMSKQTGRQTSGEFVNWTDTGVCQHSCRFFSIRDLRIPSPHGQYAVRFKHVKTKPFGRSL